MLERFRRSHSVANGHSAGRDRTLGNGDGAARDDRVASASRVERGAGARDPHDARVRKRDEFGGLNWGAAFFGWLVAVGLAVLLTAIVSAAGAAIGLTEVTGSGAERNAETIGIVGGALLLLILLCAYYAGGYVAGRMSRFDGGRQGFGVWVLGLLVTIALAVAGIIGGSEYNVLQQLELPRIPIDEGSLTTAAIVALAAIVIGTLLGAVAGGKAGQRYHRRIDRLGLEG
jgi:hypothetical protein